LNQYEAMFLFDPTFGSSFENCESEIRRLMERAEAEIVFCKKWDERRLAYKVKGRKRGLYVLVYFKAAANKIAGLERDCRLAENILRVLIVRADDITAELMEKAATTRGVDVMAEAAAKRGKGGVEEFVPVFHDEPRETRREPRRPDKRRRKPETADRP